MLDFSDTLMYIRYYTKTIRLEMLKKFRKLDYTGRIPDSNPELRGYEGCYPVKYILRSLGITNQDSIIDIGCGKGLFLYYATKFPFNAIDGIEYSAELADIANHNIAILNDSRVHVYHCDARNFDKYYDYNMFFINNPFSTEIMSDVIDEILKSYSVKKRRIAVIYQFPFNLQLFVDKGFKVKYDKFPNSVLTFE